MCGGSWHKSLRSTVTNTSLFVQQIDPAGARHCAAVELAANVAEANCEINAPLELGVPVDGVGLNLLQSLPALEANPPHLLWLAGCSGAPVAVVSAPVDVGGSAGSPQLATALVQPLYVQIVGDDGKLRNLSIPDLNVELVRLPLSTSQPGVFLTIESHADCVNVSTEAGLWQQPARLIGVAGDGWESQDDVFVLLEEDVPGADGIARTTGLWASGVVGGQQMVRRLELR